MPSNINKPEVGSGTAAQLPAVCVAVAMLANPTVVVAVAAAMPDLITEGLDVAELNYLPLSSMTKKKLYVLSPTASLHS